MLHSLDAHGVLDRLGIFCLLAYGFFWLFDIELSSYFEGLMVLIFVLTLMFRQQHRAVLGAEPLIYVLVLWVVFQVIMYHWATGLFPGLAAEHIREARVITYIFMFIIVAWWLDGDNRKVVGFLLLCVIGFCLGSIFQEHGLVGQFHKLSKSGFSLRADFGYKNAEHTSVYASFSVLVLLIFRKRFLALFPAVSGWVINILVFLSVAFSLFVIVVAQTRTTWVALTVTTIVAFIIFLNHLRKTSRVSVSYRRKLLLGSTLAVLTVMSFLSLFDARDIVAKRFGMESDVITEVVSGDIDNVRMSSLGKRLAVWAVSLEWIKERPFTGWGPQTRKVMIDESSLPEKVKEKMRHMHNSYIELLAAYGFIGLSLFVGIFLYVWYRGWQAWRVGVMPNDVMTFAALWSVYWLIVNTTESYVIYSYTGQYVDAIVAGIWEC